MTRCCASGKTRHAKRGLRISYAKDGLSTRLGCHQSAAPLRVLTGLLFEGSGSTSEPDDLGNPKFQIQHSIPFLIDARRHEEDGVHEPGLKRQSRGSSASGEGVS